MIWQIESLNSQEKYLASQLESLKAAAEPSKHDLTQLEELTKYISEEEKEINRLTEGSRQLKEKVGNLIIYRYVESLLKDLIKQKLKYCVGVRTSKQNR